MKDRDAPEAVVPGAPAAPRPGRRAAGWRGLLGCALLLAAAALAAGGCRAPTPAERLLALRAEKAESEREERATVAEVERRKAAWDRRLDELEDACRERFEGTRRAWVGPSAERFQSLLADERAIDPERAPEMNRRIDAARREFTETDASVSARLDPKEEAVLDAIERKRRVALERFDAKKVAVMAAHGARRREIEAEIAAIEARGRAEP
jgi:hypothetical protein